MWQSFIHSLLWFFWLISMHFIHLFSILLPVCFNKFSVHRPLGLTTYRRSIVTKSLSPAVSEILGPNHIGVTTLTFQGQVTSSVTWPSDSQVAVSYSCSIVTNSLSPAVFEILGPKHIRATTLTFQGHVTSSVTWPFDPQVPISYRWYIVMKPLSPAFFEILASKCIGVTTLTIWLSGSHFLQVLHCHQVAISSDFRDNGHQTYRGHDHDLSWSRDVICHVTIWFSGSHFL